MKNVSWAVPYVIVVIGCGAILSILTLLAFSHAVFGAIPKDGFYSIEVWTKGTGSSRKEAESNRNAMRQRALAFLREREFANSDVVVVKPLDDLADPAHRHYEADQQIEVRSTQYSKLARLNNALASLDPSGKSISGVYPFPAFMTFAIVVAFGYVLLLAMAVAALETRETDVTHAPRGMHPIFVGTQTALIGFLIAVAIIYSHLLVAPARLPFLFVSALGLGMLAVWLWKTAPWWRQSRFLRAAWVCYIAGIVAILMADIITLATPLT